MGHHRGTFTGDDCHVDCRFDHRRTVTEMLGLLLHAVVPSFGSYDGFSCVPDQADVVVCFWICYVVVADDLGASLSAKRDGGYSGGGVVTVFGCLY